MNDSYKKIRTDILNEQNEFGEDNTRFDKDEFIDRLLVEQKNFQKQFAGFKTIAYRPPY